MSELLLHSSDNLSSEANSQSHIYKKTGSSVLVSAGGQSQSSNEKINPHLGSGFEA